MARVKGTFASLEIARVGSWRLNLHAWWRGQLPDLGRGERSRMGRAGLFRAEHGPVAVLRPIRTTPRRDRGLAASGHGGDPTAATRRAWRGDLATISGVGTWDHLQYSHAVWEAVAWTRRAGIEERRLDGGYAVNGWLQYAHAEHATRGPNGDVQVPGVNGGEAPRYGVVKRVSPEARVLHAVRYRRIIAPSGSIYVVDRTPGTSESGSDASGSR